MVGKTSTSVWERIREVAETEMAKVEAELQWRLGCVIKEAISEIGVDFDISNLEIDEEVATLLIRVFGTPVDNKVWNKINEYWHLWSKKQIKVFKKEKEEIIFRLENPKNKIARLTIYRIYCRGSIYYYRIELVNKKGKKKEYYLFYYPFSKEIFS